MQDAKDGLSFEPAGHLQRHQTSSEELARFLSEELVHVYELLENLQQKYWYVEELLEGSISRRMRREHRAATDCKRAERVFYNSKRKTIRARVRKQCDWCGHTGHMEQDCWRKRGVCCLCGSGSHTLTACAKYVPHMPGRPEARVSPAGSKHRRGKVEPNLASRSLPFTARATPAMGPWEAQFADYDSDQSSRPHESRSNITPGDFNINYGSRVRDGSHDKSQQNMIRENKTPTPIHHREDTIQQISSVVDTYFDDLKEHEWSDSVCFASQERVPPDVLDDSVAFPQVPQPLDN